jgi:hypothetical protein
MRILLTLVVLCLGVVIIHYVGPPERGAEDVFGVEKGVYPGPTAPPLDADTLEQLRSRAAGQNFN